MRLICLTLAAVILAEGGAAAADFRIHNKVFLDDQTEPASETVTLFRGGRVYDVMDDAGEVVVFDPPRKRFVLLQPERMLRAEITFEQIDALHRRLAEKLVERADKLGAFVLDPQFDRDIAGDEGEIAFRGRWMSYELKTVSLTDAGRAAEYAKFAHWYTRLNAIKNPSLLARQPVNAWLQKQRRMPTNVKLVHYKRSIFGGMSTAAEMRSEHTLTSQLSRGDSERIDQVNRWLVEFRQAELSEYWKVSRE